MTIETKAEDAARARAFDGAFKGDGGYLPGKDAICGWVEENWPDYLTDDERREIAA